MDEESISRLVFSPHQWNEQLNEPKPGLFDDAFEFGASSIRSDGVSPADLHGRGRELEAQRHADGRITQAYIGYCTAQCSEVRQVMVQDSQFEREVCVYDTATESDERHVDIFCTNERVISERALKPYKQRIKIALVEIFAARFAVI